MLLERLLVCNKEMETAKSEADGNQKWRDFFSSFQKMFNCEEIINGCSLREKDKEVARLYYNHDEAYTWETAFSMIYSETADIETKEFKKMVRACEKRIRRTINNYTEQYIKKIF